MVNCSMVSLGAGAGNIDLLRKAVVLVFRPFRLFEEVDVQGWCLIDCLKLIYCTLAADVTFWSQQTQVDFSHVKTAEVRTFTRHLDSCTSDVWSVFYFLRWITDRIPTKGSDSSYE